jgi:hypothetical protein
LRHYSTAAEAVKKDFPGRGLNSFSFQLNLSPSVHYITHLNS